MELPKTVWDSAEPDRKRVSDEKRAQRPDPAPDQGDRPTPRPDVQTARTPPASTR